MRLSSSLSSADTVDDAFQQLLMENVLLASGALRPCVKYMENVEVQDYLRILATLCSFTSFMQQRQTQNGEKYAFKQGQEACKLDERVFEL